MKTDIKLRFPCVLWVREIENTLGIYSYGKLEDFFRQKFKKQYSDLWKQYSRRFYHYVKGVKTPSERFRKQVEKYARGTNAIFHHPLWKILQSPQAPQSDLNEWLKQLEPKVYNHLFKQSKKHGDSPRRAVRGYFYVGNIARKNSLDALAAILMLMREAELKQDFETYVTCKWEVTDLIVRLALYHPFYEVAEPIYDLVYKEFIKRNNPLPQANDDQDRSLQSILYISPSKKINFSMQLNRYLELVHCALIPCKTSKMLNELLLSFVDNFINVGLENANKELLKREKDLSK